MPPPTPTHTFNVDLTNPGQFLACCGLLELCSLIDAESLGWFSGSTFCLQSDVPLALAEYSRCPIRPAEDDIAGEDDADDGASSMEGADGKGEKSPPMEIGGLFDLRLDWWTDPTAVRAGFKMWGAGMTVAGFFDGTRSGKGDKVKQNPGMRDHLRTLLPATADLFQQTMAVDRPSPFMFDSRLSRNTTLDLGFGGGVTFAFSPAVELLAIVGLQRFRPRMEIRWDRNSFHTWREALPVNIAAAVAAGLMPVLAADRYEFAVKPRDAQGRYKAFGPARLQSSQERDER